MIGNDYLLKWIKETYPLMEPSDYEELSYCDMQKFAEWMVGVLSIPNYDSGWLRQMVWDGFLTAQYQDEQWHDEDTCNLIVKKLKGESPIEYAIAKTKCHECNDTGRWKDDELDQEINCPYCNSFIKN